MDIISFNEAATANSRIESFIENPDSKSGVLTVPKTIAAGETITIPAGRVAILPDLQVDGDLVIDGDLFIPAGSMTSQVVQKVTSTDNAVVRFDGTTGQVQNSGVIIDDSNNVGVGVTPSAWSTTNTKAIDFHTNGAVGIVNGGLNLKYNHYYNGTNDIYKVDGFASNYLQNSGQHRWYTAPSGTAGNAITWTNAMTLDTSGKLNILGSANCLEIGRDASGKYYTSYDSYLQCFKTNNGNTVFIQASDVATNPIFASYLGGVLKSAILANGTYQSALGAGGYGGTSDIKLKENITDSSNKLDKLMKVRVVDYNFKSDEAKLKQIGVIAQELEEIFPSMVYEINDTKQVEVEKEREITLEDGTTEIEKYKETETVETGEVTKGVKYGVFTMLMLKGMQEQQEIINDLKARIEVLEGAK